MIDRAALNDQREKIRAELARISIEFGLGFGSVDDLASDSRMKFVSIAQAQGLLTVLDHFEVKGFGSTGEEALMDWNNKFLELPRAGKYLAWRVRPECDWTYDFSSGEVHWRVYARGALK